MIKIYGEKPSQGNKFFNTLSAGGYSACIQGKPVQAGLNVLCNCVGLACGLFNQQYSKITGYNGMKYPYLNCNAEDFITRAKKFYNLTIDQQPVEGGIMVWEGKGSLAGHVAFVVKCVDKNTVQTSESGYNNFAFKSYTRTNANGRWGLSTYYTYLGCIVNPAVGLQRSYESTTPIPVSSNPKFKVGDKVIVSGDLYVSSNADKPTSKVSNKKTTITRYASGAKHPYNFTGDIGWANESAIKLQSTSSELKIGDKVQIKGKLYKSSNATSASGEVKKWTTTKLTRIAKGAKHPYNTTGDRGWMNASDVKKV